MIRFLLRRTGLALFVMLAVIAVVFFVLHLTGDPIGVALLGSGASADDIARIKHELGYDRPLLEQFGSFIGGMFQGRFGNSLQYGQDSLVLTMQRLPYTLSLAGVALLLTIVVAVPLGILAAVRRGRATDRIVIGLAAFGQSVPSFVVGPLLILVFAVGLRWFPVAGAGSPMAIVLPAVTLALFPMSRVMRLVRTSMIEVLGADYVTTARAKGQREGVVIMRHAFRNALLAVATVIALQLTSMIGGAVIVEAVFGWPGIGSLAKDALINSDFALAQTIVIITAAGVVLINLITDIAYSLLDPRIGLK
ncbi:ABC transporter permease [Microbacterium sp.]|uniref:ABC transporter permease n=1 Tax=Microbacterium sp. TaxID=51671 RepID=UPI0033419962